MQQQNRKFGLFKKQLPMQIFVWLGIIWLVFFSYLPLSGLSIAFKDFNIRDGFSGMFFGEWVGLRYFREFITDRKFPTLLRNTVVISFLKLIFSFPLAIIFAIMISEMRWKGFKRISQTVSYLPHFISWVIVAGIFFAFFSQTNGVVNNALKQLGLIDEPIDILTNPDRYYLLATISELWKETGWSAIIYLAAINGIDQGLYESAQIDGAGRLQRIRYITLPGIKSTAAIILILSSGSLMAGNFDQAMMLGNNMNVARSEILDVYIYQTGLGLGRYSYAAAAGLFQSVISMALVLLANRVSRQVSDTSLF